SLSAAKGRKARVPLASGPTSARGIPGALSGSEWKMANVEICAPLHFIDRGTLAFAQEAGLRTVDYRKPDLSGPRTGDTVECVIRDARPSAAELTLDTCGFTLVRRPSAVRDWFDSDEVIGVYYEECRALARELTGASHAFTFDHVIREPGRQTGGG